MIAQYYDDQIKLDENDPNAEFSNSLPAMDAYDFEHKLVGVRSTVNAIMGSMTRTYRNGMAAKWDPKKLPSDPGTVTYLKLLDGVMYRISYLPKRRGGQIQYSVERFVPKSVKIEYEIPT
jgi:hypothetical protein